MKNYIRSLPVCSTGDSSKRIGKKELKLALSRPNLNIEYAPFEFTTFTSLKQSPRRLCLSLSPKNKITVLDTVIDELKSIKTIELRKKIGVTEKDLKNRVNCLKVLTRLDFDEFMEIKLKRWNQRGFVKVEEREIRQIIKRDTKTVKNLL